METQKGYNELSEDFLAKRELLSWQNRMMPTMRKLIIGLTFFFFLATLGQLAYLNYSIRSFPKLELQTVPDNFKIAEKDSFQERKEIMRLKALIILEANAFQRRHHHSNIVLMSSIWIRYLAFVTGMILALIGAIFILGKLEESQSVIGGSLPSAEFTVRSSSPGIILAVLGSSLMLATIIMQHSFNVSDASVYLGTGNTSTVEGDTEPPTLHFDPDSVK
jgi:hypothetical protein